MMIGNDKNTIEIKENLFEPIESDFSSNCDNLPSLTTSDNQLLVLFGVNDRPSPSRIAAIVVNPKNGKVIQLNENVGQKWGKASKLKDSILIPAVQGWKKNPTSDGPENVFAGKLKVSFKAGVIKKEWLTKLPASFTEQ